MKYIKILIIAIFSIYILFGHNPENWNEKIDGKVYSEIKTIFGKPSYRCSEVGACDVWISGYLIFGVYIFPSIMIVSFEGNKLEKTFIYLPFYSHNMHKFIIGLAKREP